MLINLILLLLLALLISSCASYPPQMRSVTEGDAQLYLKEAPRAADHPNAGANIPDNYNYFEFFPDGTSVNKIAQRKKIFTERGRSFASSTINYRDGYQSVKIIYADTIRPNGNVFLTGGQRRC